MNKHGRSTLGIWGYTSETLNQSIKEVILEKIPISVMTAEKTVQARPHILV